MHRKTSLHAFKNTRLIAFFSQLFNYYHIDSRCTFLKFNLTWKSWSTIYNSRLKFTEKGHLRTLIFHANAGFYCSTFYSSKNDWFENIRSQSTLYKRLICKKKLPWRMNYQHWISAHSTFTCQYTCAYRTFIWKHFAINPNSHPSIKTQPPTTN